MRTDAKDPAGREAGPVPTIIVVAPVLLGLLMFHFVMVGLYVCPPNPVSLTARPWVHAYISPYFTQRWQLFAPEPGGINEYVHVRCHLVEGDQPRITPWVDVTTPLLRAHQRNRLGASSRMLRASMPRLIAAQSKERAAIDHLDGPLADEARARLDREAQRVFEQGRAHLQRLASAECKRRHAAPDVRIERVEARRLSKKVPPYGMRHRAPPDPGRGYALPPMDYVEVSL